jgi:hypothetical protein
MLLAGGVGLAAAVIGTLCELQAPRAFIGFWLAVSVVPSAGAFLLIRRQALRDAEPFWSPPTRRVVQAVLPPFAAAVLAGLATAVIVDARMEPVLANRWATQLLPVAWVVLYGCASHAAGFFMPRGIRLFGWLFVAGGCATFGLLAVGGGGFPPGHAIMGFFFGALHLAYGGYLRFTELRTNAA